MNDRILSYLVQDSKEKNESVVVSYINRSTHDSIRKIFEGSDYCVREFDFTGSSHANEKELIKLAEVPSLYLLKFADNSRSRVAASQFIYRLCSYLTDFADRQKDAQLPVETSVYLGEFEYLDRLPKWGIYTGLMRKRSLHTIMLSDSFFQLRKVYSKNADKNDWLSLMSYNMSFCYGGTLIIRDQFRPESGLGEVYAPFFRINAPSDVNTAEEKSLAKRMFKLISGGIHAQGKGDESLFESIDVQDSKFIYHGKSFKRVPRYAPNRLALQLLCGGKISESEFFSTLIHSAYTLVSFVPHDKIKDWKIEMLDFLYGLCGCVRVNSREFMIFLDEFISCGAEELARTEMYFDFHDFQGFNNMELKDVITNIQFFTSYMTDLKQQVIDEGGQEYNADFEIIIKAYRSCFVSNDSRLECDFDFCLIAWIAAQIPKLSHRDVFNAVKFTCAVDDLLMEYLEI